MSKPNPEVQGKALMGLLLRKLFGVEVPTKDLNQLWNTYALGYKTLEQLIPKTLPSLGEDNLGGTSHPLLYQLRECPCLKEELEVHPWAAPRLYITEDSWVTHQNLKEHSIVFYYRSARDQINDRREMVSLGRWCTRRRVDAGALIGEYFSLNRGAFLKRLGTTSAVPAVLTEGTEIARAYCNFTHTHSSAYPGLRGSCMSDPELGDIAVTFPEGHPCAVYGDNNGESPVYLWRLQDDAGRTIARTLFNPRTQQYLRLYTGGYYRIVNMFVQWLAHKELAALGLVKNSYALEGCTVGFIRNDEDTIVAPYLDGNITRANNHEDDGYWELVECGGDIIMDSHTTGLVEFCEEPRGVCGKCGYHWNAEDISAVETPTGIQQWCSDCVQDYARCCANCDVLVTYEPQRVTADGEPLCQACYSDLETNLQEATA